MYLENPTNEKYSKHVKILGATIDGHKLTKQEIKDCSKKSDSHVAFDYPIDIDGKKSIRVTTVGQVLKQKIDMETWTSFIPSSGITLNLKHPENIDLGIQAMHSEVPVLVAETETSKTWELNHGMLPKQGIMFWWKYRA
jgi:hypothetical protein